MWTSIQAKVGRDTCGNWKGICGPFCNDDTNERGLRLLEFASFNDLVLANTFGHYNASRRWTWYSPNGQHHNQIDYSLVRKRFLSGVNIARTRGFPGADIGSGHNLLMMTFCLRLKKKKKKNQQAKTHKTQVWPRKAERSQRVETFQAMIGGKFAPLTIMSNEDTGNDWDSQWDP